MKYLLTLIALGAFALSGHAQTFEWNTKSATPTNEVQLNTPARIAYEKAYNERQVGQASIYADNAQGSRTVSGETYSQNQLTASHPVLPVGTIVRLQNLDNGRTVNVRINDKGRECSDCLITVSRAAANQLGITYRGRVAVERTGFSNWNPSVTVQPSAYTSVPAYGGVTRPVEINQNNQWESRGTTAAPSNYGSTPTASPLAYGNATTYNPNAAYGTTTPVNQGNYAVLNAPATPSVMSREVQPATVTRQPATYSRYPTAVTPTNQENAQPRAYQPAPAAAATTTYAPVYQQTVPPQQAPATTQQATPPPSTVMRYQESRTVPAPATYSAPSTYSPPAGMTARGVNPTVAPPTPAAAARNYVVQLGAYNNESYAQNRVTQLQKMGLSNVFYRSVQKEDGQFINRVYAGTFASMAEAQQASKLIQGNYQIAGIVSAL